jgi:hypothetical protein
MNSGKSVIFSHGFGVKRDSRGMFKEIGDILKDKYLVIRFDYNKILEDENVTYVYPLGMQAEILRKVMNFTRDKLNAKELNIIAHSFGCLIVGELFPRAERIVLNAPPMESPYKEMIEHFSSRKETELNENGLSKIKRSDGSWTYIGSDFWNEVKSTEPVKMYLNLSKTSKTTFIRALKDERIRGGDYGKIESEENIEYVELVADHNFSGLARQIWLDKLKEILVLK